MIKLKLQPRLPALDDFMEHLNSITWPHPVLNGRVYGETLIQAYPVGDFIYLQLIHSAEKGKGHGSMALRTLIMLADKHGVAMVLAPIRVGDEGLGTRELRKWYGRYGFKAAGDRRMRREPNTPPRLAAMAPTTAAQRAK
jgi:hypothetical protein